MRTQTPQEHLGTFVPKSEPSSDLLKQPFEDETCLARMYCENCGLLNELSEEALLLILQVIELINETEPQKVSDIDWSRHYIHAKGCTSCTEDDDLRFMLCEIS